MLSEKIRDLRKKAGLSQEELAEKLDVSRQAVSKWELGAAVPTADKLLEISDLFGVSLDHLMREEPRDHDKLNDHDNSEDRVADVSVHEKTSVKAHVFRKAAAIFLFTVAGLAVLLLVLLCSLLGGDDVKNSLVITLNGVGILAGAAAVCALLGIVLLIFPKK